MPSTQKNISGDCFVGDDGNDDGDGDGVYNHKSIFRVGYDAPFKFWNRKNEVFVVKSD